MNVNLILKKFIFTFVIFRLHNTYFKMILYILKNILKIWLIIVHFSHI